MAKQEEMFERRMDMLFLDRLGIKPKDWIREIAFKYKTSTEAVKRDWSRRKTWMRQALKIEDAEALALDILYDYEKALQDSFKLFNEAEKIPDKVHALWARLKAIQLREKYLDNVGALDQIRINFEYRSDYDREKKEEEKYPYKKGERDRHIRQTALLLNMTKEELANSIL
jgi:hypothetical protein